MAQFLVLTSNPGGKKVSVSVSRIESFTGDGDHAVIRLASRRELAVKESCAELEWLIWFANYNRDKPFVNQEVVDHTCPGLAKLGSPRTAGLLGASKRIQ